MTTPNQILQLRITVIKITTNYKKCNYPCVINVFKTNQIMQFRQNNGRECFEELRKCGHISIFQMEMRPQQNQIKTEKITIGVNFILF